MQPVRGVLHFSVDRDDKKGSPSLVLLTVNSTLVPVIVFMPSDGKPCAVVVLTVASESLLESLQVSLLLKQEGIATSSEELSLVSTHVNSLLEKFKEKEEETVKAALFEENEEALLELLRSGMCPSTVEFHCKHYSLPVLWAVMGVACFYDLLHKFGIPLYSRGPAGLTALHHAASLGYSDVVEKLCSCTLLLHMRSYDEVMDNVVFRGITVSNPGGRTPLHVAAQNKRFEVAEALAAAGALIRLCDYNGDTPFDAFAEELAGKATGLEWAPGLNPYELWRQSLPGMPIATGRRVAGIQITHEEAGIGTDGKSGGGGGGGGGGGSGVLPQSGPGASSESGVGDPQPSCRFCPAQGNTWKAEGIPMAILTFGGWKEMYWKGQHLVSQREQARKTSEQQRKINAAMAAYKPLHPQFFLPITPIMVSEEVQQCLSGAETLPPDIATPTQGVYTMPFFRPVEATALCEELLNLRKYLVDEKRLFPRRPNTMNRVSK